MKNVLITGATRGIGREIVLQLSALGGYKIFATGRDAQLLETLKAETGCLGETCDLSNAKSVVELYATASQKLGTIDVLINNAGFNKEKTPITETQTDDLDRSYAVNYRAPYLLCREAVKEMGPRRTGQIINIISSLAKTSAANYSVYCPIKHALKGLTQCLIKEAAPQNI